MAVRAGVVKLLSSPAHMSSIRLMPISDTSAMQNVNRNFLVDFCGNDREGKWFKLNCKIERTIVPRGDSFQLFLFRRI